MSTNYILVGAKGLCAHVTANVLTAGNFPSLQSTPPVMNHTFNLITTTYCGGRTSLTFDDRVPYGPRPAPVIAEIVVGHSHYIFKLKLTMSDGKSMTHGEGTGTDSLINLETGESVNRIELRADSNFVYGLTFVTNKRKYGLYGDKTGDTFAWGAEQEPAPGARRISLCSFSGSCDPKGYLRGLQALFAEDYSDLLPPIRYESVTGREGPVRMNTSLPTEVSKSFSNFTYHLMSPTITLCIGPNQVKLYANENTLCQLPFFNAALRGNFKEATERVITMPEDTPGDVSALIEFISTGNYTCMYDPAITRLHKGSTAPVGSLTEVLFHVDIHTIATKYNCLGLAAIAARNIEVVAADLDSLHALRAWQAAYSTGLRLPGKREKFEAYCDGGGLVAWLKCLFAEHSEDLRDAMAECPMLGFDLFRISVAEE